jgi:hypothetical protein
LVGERTDEVVRIFSGMPAPVQIAGISGGQ